MKLFPFIVISLLSALTIGCEKLAFDFSGTDSTIIFLSQRNDSTGGQHLFRMNSDGTGQEKITDLSARFAKPVVSHSGKMLLFGHYTPDYFYELYSIDIDGTNLTLIDRADRYCGSPDWSSDDTKIVYLKNRDETTDEKDIVLFDLIRNSKHVLTGSGNISYVIFSPDNQIVYCRETVNDTIGAYWGFNIYKMKADGTDMQILILNAYGPVYSPDGKKIAYLSHGLSGNAPQIFTANADGRNSKQLTYAYLQNWDSGFPSFGNYNPHWTPDGENIVYVSDVHGGTPEIYIMNSDGRDKTRLTNTDRRNENPEVTSDGQFILFSSNRDLDIGFDIFVMGINGKNQASLSNFPGSDILPVEAKQTTQAYYEH